ncbi:MAG: PilZ domain-containing protein, partial [Spirochaetes bacterium]|nr:PilZ domain-containing protein [Spirochaetota bacterium]
VIALFSEIFIVINLISLIIYKGSNLYWYILPLIFSIYSLGIVGYMRLTSIRKLPFLFYNIKFFRPYFRHRCYADALLNNRMRKFESKLISISNKGAHFLANKVVQVGDEYNLIFKFNGKELRLKIKVIRVIVGELSYINGFGAKIIKIDNKTKQALLAYLRESESIQIYRPRFKGVNISIDIISDEGVIKNKIYDIDKKGAFIISNDRWRLNDKIIGNIKIKDDQYKIEGEIIRLNDKQEISYPKGFAIIFEKYPDDFHKRLKKVVKK